MIFDLDDTLIETSKCITPRALARAFERMQESGLGADTKALERLLFLNERAPSSREALALFTESYRGGAQFFKIGLNALSLPLQDNFCIEPVPHALATLDQLKKKYLLALVTKGSEALQYQKMEKAGIQPERFSKLIVSHAPSKKEAYQSILDDLEVPPEQGIVCGDRVMLDLCPAKELGLLTVHFRNGRGRHQCNPQESVDMTIDCLTELEEVLAKYEV